MRTTLLLPAMTLIISGAVQASEVFSMEPDWVYELGGSSSMGSCIETLLLNEDAYPDLIVYSLGFTKIMTFYGQGDGSFIAYEEHSIDNVYWLESSDIDSDGDYDVLARLITDNCDSILIYQNNGLGNLELTISISDLCWGIPTLARFIAVDLNNDSNQDLVTINPGSDVYGIFGDGCGGFSTSMLYVGDEDLGYGFDCGDIDDDGDVDIVYIGLNALNVLLNDGYGAFSLYGQYSGVYNYEGYVGSLGFGLLNGDNFQDIACAPGACMGDPAITTFLGDGQGGLEQYDSWGDGITFIQTDIDDYNLDGFSDAFFTGDSGHLLMLGNGTGDLGVDYYFSYGARCTQVGMSDLDLDGDIDYVTATDRYGSPFQLEVFLNKTIQTGIGDSGTESFNGSLLLEISENPVSAASEVHFFLPEATGSSLTVYDIHGREVDVLQEGNLSPGDYSVVWDAMDLPVGCYTLVLRTETASVSRRCIRI